MEFNDEWKIYKLENLFDIKAAGDLDKNTFSNDCDRIFKYPLYANALTNKGLIGFSSIAKYPKNSLTVTARGDLGKAFVRKTKFNASGRLLILQQKVNLDLEFISNYINGKLNIFIENTGVPQLTAPNFKTYKIKMPILEEQQKIGRFLSLINEKIELMEKNYYKLNKFKKGIIQQILSVYIRFKSFKEKGDSYLINDCIIESNNKNKNEDILPILSSTLSGIYLQEDYFKKTVASNSTNNYKIINKGYFTYRSMSDTGIFRFNIQNIYSKALISPAYPVFKVKDFINPKFFEYYLNNSPLIKKQLRIMKEGGTRYALPISKFKKMKILIPPLKEQETIADFLSKIDNKIDSVEQQLEKIKEFKKYLLQQMFV